MASLSLPLHLALPILGISKMLSKGLVVSSFNVSCWQSLVVPGPGQCWHGVLHGLTYPQEHELIFTVCAGTYEHH